MPYLTTVTTNKFNARYHDRILIAIQQSILNIESNIMFKIYVSIIILRFIYWSKNEKFIYVLIDASQVSRSYLSQLCLLIMPIEWESTVTYCRRTIWELLNVYLLIKVSQFLHFGSKSLIKCIVRSLEMVPSKISFLRWPGTSEMAIRYTSHLILTKVVKLSNIVIIIKYYLSILNLLTFHHLFILMVSRNNCFPAICQISSD